MTEPLVETTGGVLRGTRLPGGPLAFRGIPFASPPLGAGRFAPPRPLEPWTGERDATRFGDAAVQISLGAAGGAGAMFGPGELPTSEDCLTLNVWTPAADDRRRPVMVWIHGGAFRLGTSGSPMYDGRRLAERGDVVVVSTNYRLGLLGFLASPELGAANSGLLDQVAALRWVQAEIERFGGDPGNVTIFGESAGAKSVECLLAMPSAAGLFHRAILQSTYATRLDADRAHERTRAIAAEAGVADDLEQLRHLDVDALLAAEVAVMAAAGPEPIGAGGGGPVVDGDTLPRAPLDAVAAGATSTIPLLVGTTLDEYLLFAAMGGAGSGPDEAELPARIAHVLGETDPSGPAVAATIDAYRAARAERGAADDPMGILADAMTDRMFRQHSIRLAELAATHGSVHMYLFTAPSPIDVLGACHGIELPYVFGTLDAVGGFAGEGPDADALSAAVQDAWIAFARDGAPASGALPDWPAYEPTRRATMLLGEVCEVQDAPMEALRQSWEGRVL